MVSLGAAHDLMSEVEHTFHAALLDESDAPGHEETERLLRELGRPEPLRAFLVSLTRERMVSAEFAWSAHRHALGFDKFVLLDFGSLGQLRMHVWWPGQGRVREHVHNHRFHFSSVVVGGSLRCRYYRSVPGGRRYAHLRECSRPHDAGWSFQRQGVVEVAETLSVDFAAGSSYSMPADLWHRVDASTMMTVTLMLQRQCVRDWSSVLIGDDEVAPTQLPRRMFTAAEMQERMSTLIDYLGGQGGVP
ncbi:hypothetical protein ACGFIK_08980 [Micromonospora sp. NPDC048871]|uniref:hypothetical protein n=1 Tax=unclassified Micromonospora TaxID=2617518 RepID=UPI002E0F81BD|nr:hypothetical protein OIE53_20990 [Micromonospora sp. NBC_01739]